MRYVKWIAIGLAIIILIGVAVFFITRLISPKMVQAPEPSQNIESVLEENKSDMSKVKSDLPKISKPEDVYTIIHKMANTLIVAEDGLIYGLTPIDDTSITQAMVIVNSTDVIDKTEKEVLLNFLNRWKKDDYSNAVKEHNYVWNKLGGNIGKAVDIRPEFKK